MNCDQVFDVLTRGPFPTGTSCDVPVEAHLSRCADCRRLAEALRPAIELFQEAVDPEESRDLPGYWCGAPSEAQRASVSYAAQAEPRTMGARVEASKSPATSALAGTAWRMAAMVVLGVTLGALANARWVLDGSSFSGFGGGASIAPLADRDDEGRANLVERLGLAVLPAACFRRADGSPHEPAGGEQLVAGIDLSNLNCCSGCHHAGSELAAKAATAKVAASCQLCHVSRP
jgi:hypothetical protein